MKSIPICFHYHYKGFKVKRATNVKSWLTKAATSEKSKISKLDYYFISDQELLEMNRTVLKHDYYTDIITFPYSYDPIIGEIYISVDRVKENAVLFDVTQNHELLRVMVHGLLHLCGYDDQNKKAKKLMTEKEDFYLGRRL